MRRLVRHVLRHAFKYALIALAVSVLTGFAHGRGVYGAIDAPPAAPPLAPWMTQEWLIAFTGAASTVVGGVLAVAKLIQCLPTAVNSAVGGLKRAVAVLRGQPDPGPLPEPPPEPSPPAPPAAA